jgi:hypothetical protein
MVRAILEGRKTQTRRVVKPQPHTDCSHIEVDHYHPTVIDKHGDEAPGDEIFGAYSLDGEWGAKCPYGAPGDRLWVRETWTADFDWPEESGHPRTLPWADVPAAFRGPKNCTSVYYAADRIESHPPLNDGYWIPRECQPTDDEWEQVRWKPSIHMPRWACRIVLEVVSVRVERVHDISRADAKAEGFLPSEFTGLESWNGQMYGNAELAFAACWRDINGLASWYANPWVWVVEFKAVTP